MGVQLHPQATTMDELRAAWRAADEVADSLWLWDHFFPIYAQYGGDERHFEGWTALAAMAVETTRATVGVLVTGNGYRNPDLLADMARTVDHLSGGRCVLGIGAGWARRDYEEYGYDFGEAPDRLRALGEALPRIRSRLDHLRPPPLQERLPLLVGGGGEKVTLRLVATHADIWNGFGPPEEYARKSRVLDEWCEKVGRDPAAVERSVTLDAADVDAGPALVDAGATHLVVSTGHPYDLEPARRLRSLVS